MFGAGNAGSTTNNDSGDGVTNPPAICTSDGTSSGQICNDHQSSVADDDGGFIRMSGAAYFQSPVALNGVPAAAAAPVTAPAPAPPPAAASPSLQVTLGGSAIEPGDAVIGQEVALRQDFTPSSNAVVLVDFELYDSQGQRVWATAHDNVSVAAGASFTETTVLTVPDSLPPGQYAFKSGVFSAGWGTVYAWNDHAGILTIVE